MDYLLISSFNQIATMAGLQSAAVLAGACHNFALSWCAVMFRVWDPSKADFRMAQLKAGKGGANPVLQKTFVDAWNEPGRDWRSADVLGMAVRGLVRVGYAIPLGNFNQAAVTAVVKAPQHPAMVYAFDRWNGVAGAGLESHTIAFFRQLRKGQRGGIAPADDQVSVFDPNYGEYLVPSLEFNYWFSKLKAHYTGTPPTMQFAYHALFYCELSGRKAL
jgi:hypothetical protein